MGGILEASPDRPYLGLRVLLDPALITTVLVEADHLAPRANGTPGALTVSRISACSMPCTGESRKRRAPVLDHALERTTLEVRRGAVFGHEREAGAVDGGLNHEVEVIRIGAPVVDDTGDWLATGREPIFAVVYRRLVPRLSLGYQVELIMPGPTA